MPTIYKSESEMPATCPDGTEHDWIDPEDVDIDGVEPCTVWLCRKCDAGYEIGEQLPPELAAYYARKNEK